jgi:hypothetical protein
MSSPNFQSILDALDNYTKQTGINLKDEPFADKVKGCDSPGAILRLLEENVKTFEEYRNKNRKFIDCLSPVVKFVHTFSGILGEAAGLVRRLLSFSIYSFLSFSSLGSVPTDQTHLRRHRCSLRRACFPCLRVPHL